jgi:hypothetical protein
MLQTQSDDRWEATTQIDAPDPVEGTYQALWKNWDRAMKQRAKEGE